MENLTTKRRVKLGVIASKASSHTGWKKFWYYLVGIYIGGVLRGRYQKDFSDRVGWSTAKLTLLNAVLFGGFATLEYFVVGVHSNFILDKVGSFFYLSSDTSLAILRDYAYFNAVQSLFRIVCALVLKWGMLSFSIEGLFVNLIYPRVRNVGDKFSGKFIDFKNLGFS